MPSAEELQDELARYDFCLCQEIEILALRKEVAHLRATELVATALSYPEMHNSFNNAATRLIQTALVAADGNISATAALLQMHRTQLRYTMRRLGIVVERQAKVKAAGA